MGKNYTPCGRNSIVPNEDYLFLVKAKYHHDKSAPSIKELKNRGRRRTESRGDIGPSFSQGT